MIRSTLMMIFHFGLPLLTILQFHLTEGTACVTPDQKPGNCIIVRECDSAIEILRGPKPIPTDLATFLRDSQCGYEGETPKVCCEILNSTTVSQNRTNDLVENFPTPPDVSRHRNLHLINTAQCGVITQNKIWGGEKTGIFEYPWMAMIAYNRSNIIEFKCSGTIINKRYILTAAHCITFLPEQVTLKGVRVGDHDISTEQDCEPGSGSSELMCAEKYQNFEIESTLHHPNFMMPKLQNDIGIIRVKGDMDFRPRSVRPICLPVDQKVPSLTEMSVVTGWGETETGANSNYMVGVQLPLVANARCQEVYKNKAPIDHKQICAGASERKDACIGDSGGPLQIPGIINGTVKLIQQGIVSFGLKTACGIKGYPGVYARIVYYMDWILDNISE